MGAAILDVVSCQGVRLKTLRGLDVESNFYPQAIDLNYLYSCIICTLHTPINQYSVVFLIHSC